jgi:4-hydroxy-3-polyprenylbenzoate decarboxylase
MLIAITGASGIDLAVKLIEKLQENGIQIELIISKLAQQLIKIESNYEKDYIEKLATKIYDVDDLTAEPSSGSYLIDTMVIIPCSMKTLAAIANGYANNLITRAADVMIKEKRRLLLAVRESPFSAIHLENMLKLARLGVIIAPPVPSYYFNPKSIEDFNNHIVGRILDQLGIKSDIKRWGAI